MKFYILILFLFSLTFNINFLNTKAKEDEKTINLNSINKIDWKYSEKISKEDLLWYEVNEKENYLDRIKKINQKSKKNIISVRSNGKGVTINGFYYPDISNYVPNAYVEDPNRLFGLSTRGISKTRSCRDKNFSYNCTDGVLDFDFKLFNNNNLSIYPEISLQSLTNRGTEFGEGVSLGIKIAKELSDSWSIAFGGKNIVHFDETIDLGRNFYVVASKYFPVDSLNKSSIFFLNFGLGSDFYGYKGNGFLFRTPCLGKNTLTGTLKEPNSCSWGPIASASLSFNDRFSVISEWFGYSYGLGFSARPYKESSLSFAIFATDFIEGFPKYAEDHCANSMCETRFYGSISLNF